MYSKLLFLAFFTFIFNFSTSAQSDGWQFLKTTNGINIYTKEVNGLKELKMQANFKKPLSVLVGAVQDVSSYPKWVYKVNYSEKIQQVNDWEYVYYNFLDFPWPLTDRDVVVYAKVSQNPKTKMVTSYSTSQSGYKDKRKDVIRINDMRTQWVMKSTPEGVFAEYYLRSHPGGEVPTWSVNAAIDEGPIKTMTALQKLVNNGYFDNKANKNILD
jgi:START domain